VTHGSSYRADIDGLRTVAVMPVVAFHLWPHSVPYGYLGVDIFFVISGYLITAILIRDIQTASFSFRHFWARRVKRLFPAMSVVLSVCLISGYFVLYADEWKSLARQTLSVLTFSANVFMWRYANNYWGESAETMLMLHTWSLAVEEQFYILFPVVLIVLSKYCRHRFGKQPDFALSAFLLFALIASFLLSLYGAVFHKSAAFYLLPTRAWEILVGCSLASCMCSSRRESFTVHPWRRYFATFGLGLVMVAYSADLSLAGGAMVNAILACLGTVVILAFSVPREAFAGKILSIPSVVFLGKISYSLYLWHWPVIVFGRYVGDFSGLTLLLTSVSLATVTYLSIECQTRFLADGTFFKVFCLLLLMVGISLLLPFVIQRTAIRYDVPQFCWAASVDPRRPTNWEEFQGSFRQGLILADRNTIDRLDVLQIGDSHSSMFFPAVEKACKSLHLSFGFYGASAGASPFFVAENRSPYDYSAHGWTPEDRQEFDRVRREFLSRYRPRIVIVCSRWEFQFERLGFKDIDNHLKQLLSAAPDSGFVFVGQPPVVPHGIDGFKSGFLDLPILRAQTENGCIRRQRMAANDIVKKFCQEHRNCWFVGSEHLFLDGPVVKFLDEKTMLYDDDDHLSIDGSLRCTDIFLACLRDLLPKTKFTQKQVP
jgi:peptidoglycan/LPS O-acetylase OafA/YrhL